MLPLQITRRPFALVTAVTLASLLFCGRPCLAQAEAQKIRVVTSLFPLYDFARQVAGDRAEVSLLLAPGMEAHSFEPTPADIMRINRADIFIYTGASMEPWVRDVLKGLDNPSLLVVNASSGIKLSAGADPHIWLDFSYARQMVTNIMQAFVAKDPEYLSTYLANTRAYHVKLAELDLAFRKGLANCAQRTFIHGGHFAFGYLAARYHLEFLSAYPGFAANTEPGPRDLARLTQIMHQRGIKYVYCDKFISPRIASVIAQETGAEVLLLNGAHNLTKEEMAQGISFISIMEDNLQQLKKGLECQ
ncbi:MAG TPA: zinc ABC transporter substrate-binding protein [Patescibacteria group bacterium]|nr:zinc ABC transporter substrate-binding protein [Patescibacteria group bacterium]